MDNWVPVFTSSEVFVAEIIKGLLIDSEIPAVILNQVDSSYRAFGEVSVMVSLEDQEKANELIKNYNDRE